MQIKLNLSEARELGELYYFSGKECKNGHTSKRLVSTQQCCKCLHDRKIMQRKPDFTMDRKESMVKRKVATNLGLKHYNTGKPCSKGHLSPRLTSTRQCVACLKSRTQARKAKLTERSKMRRNALKRRLSSKIKQRKYQSQVLFSRADYRLRVFMRSCLTRLMVSKGGSRTSALLGYSRFDLMKRIEFNFKDGMSWDNYGKWHIDHKKPVSRFISQGITNPAIINALSNLQPLWAKDNISKSNKF